MRDPTVKSPLCLCLVVAFSLSSWVLFARTGEQPPANSSDSEAAVTSLPEDGTLSASSQFTIPGPLRSFLRMAGISQKVSPEEVLPLLSRNVYIQGYEGPTRPTEFLILLRRYVSQARELADLAASHEMSIRVSSCVEAQPLLRILGYRIRGNCGEPGTSLLTEDPERAFLAIDSGFPLPQLEQTLQGGKPFEYAYTSVPVPVLFAESDWTKASKKNYVESSKDLLDTILIDPKVARLYWAFSKLDLETSRYLQRSIGIGKLLPYAAVLDFYGRRLSISGGRVIVPGGVNAEPAWQDLVGASPTNPAAFVQKLVAKDKGWLAAYFDALSRVSGNLQVWKEIVLEGENSSFTRKSGMRSSSLSTPDELVKVLFALSRAPTDSGPLQVYMAISELDSRRIPERRLAPETFRLLARKFEEFSDQYRIFSEFPELSDDSITLFLNVAQGLNTAPSAMRGNAFGTFQAMVGIWQILARQGEIPKLEFNDSWQQVVKPFAAMRSAPQLYDAGRTSLAELFRSATGKPRPSQDEIIELLAGPPQTTPEGMRIHRELAGRIRSVLDDQRLVSLDKLLT